MSTAEYPPIEPDANAPRRTHRALHGPGTMPCRLTKLRVRIWEDGRTMTAIAKELGVGLPRLCDWANAVRPLPPARIPALCQILHCTPQDIVGYEDVG